MSQKSYLSLTLMLLLLACKATENEIKLPINIENGYIIIISEYDCSSCVTVLRNKINQLQTAKSETVGFYFKKTKSKNTYIDEITVKYPQLNWQELGKEQFSDISLKSFDGSSPFVLTIKNRKIVEIKSITK